MVLVIFGGLNIGVGLAGWRMCTNLQFGQIWLSDLWNCRQNQFSFFWIGSGHHIWILIEDVYLKPKCDSARFCSSWLQKATTLHPWTESWIFELDLLPLMRHFQVVWFCSKVWSRFSSFLCRWSWIFFSGSSLGKVKVDLHTAGSSSERFSVPVR